MLTPTPSTPQTTNHALLKNNTTVELRQTSLAGYLFATTGPGTPGTAVDQVLRAVTYDAYVRPPKGSIILSEPINTQARFTNLSEWIAAVSTCNGIWTDGHSDYLKANCRIFSSIPSSDSASSAYDLSFPQPAPTGEFMDEIDPGQVFVWNPINGLQQGAAVRGLGRLQWKEFWVLLPSYAPPGLGSVSCWGPYPSAVQAPNTTAPDAFLHFWSQSKRFLPGSKLVVCSVNRYRGYIPDPA